ncbi:type IV pilus biogenesis protein PilM [Serratia sp. UGAL515B_01]|uniref:type IV pilus biogenesis protein PilM n=1 Tax=Serratia sp. UGAL515B_01 TaxID=2986763 RepID=UPI0029536C06|nr:pilus assembly protein PilM [Serratia sp. UGAL515B_01]WON76744.1 pilus assembly protein PilM [Serratia sp. UGAL515B_01]
MFSQVWQVGLDIQSHCVRALAAQYRRSGWQLRHWWQQALPHPVLREGCLEETDTLVTILKQWRNQLPRHISLRIALPAQRVLQHTLPLPDFRLREPIRHDYITSQGLRQFPLDSQTLVMDYRPAPPNSHHLLLTAARQQELQQWLDCLLQAELQPEVVDITPNALSVMAGAVGLSQDVGLLHRLEYEWLWVAPRTEAFTYGVLPVREAESVEQALSVIGAACPTLATKGVYYSSVIDEVVAEGIGAISWSPFTAFSRLYPPLPLLPTAFVLAGGLALRGEDN